MSAREENNLKHKSGEIIMILSYLNNIKEKYITEQNAIKNQLNNYDTELKENIKFTKMLEESAEDESTYEAFTPRSVIPNNKKKIDELLEEQKKIKDKIQKLNNRYFELESKLNEVKDIIQEAEKENEQEQINKNKLNSLPTEKLRYLLHKTELCYRLIEIDPIRCKLELSSVLKMINDIMDEM